MYPAQVVHQVKDWGQSEFDILKKGEIEEYILNILDFDLMFLTPIDFIEFMTGNWNSLLPVKSCTNNASKDLNHKSFVNKLKLYAINFCKQMALDLCGYSFSVKYLPSVIAVKSIQLAQQLILQQEGVAGAELYMSESMGIAGFESLASIDW